MNLSNWIWLAVGMVVGFAVCAVYALVACHHDPYTTCRKCCVHETRPWEHE